MNYSILDKINSPEDLRSLPKEEIPALAEEIRSFLIEKVERNGGHLASNLGVVELSLALHRVFETPKDRIIWDVGHQSYIHKIITGRKDKFDQLRQAGGLSGFTRREESEHDCFGAGHSSTSISAALGFAEADKLSGNNAYTVAVIGDGAFTGGMVHEALNNCSKDLKLIIILNENEMSISKNIGGFAKYIAHVRASRRYLKTKKRTASFLKKIPLLGNALYCAVRDTKQWFKNILYASNYFEELGLFYIGPVDGNDFALVETLLQEAKQKGESVIIHLKTQKGKGYLQAEENPNLYHSVYVNTGEEKRFPEVFGEELIKIAERDEKVCAITAAMADGTGLFEFSQKFPQRFFDVGIAEEHALTFGAGLAAAGMKPYFAVYSTFLQRGYDNLLHDVALQRLPVRICVDRAGLATSDGATHHGIFDVAFASHIPEVEIYSPSCFGSLRTVMEATKDSQCPVLIRYSNIPDNEEINNEFYSDGNFDKVCALADTSASDADIVIVTYGRVVKEALKAKQALARQGKRVAVILAEKLKPYSDFARCVASMLPKKCTLVFLEEGIYYGGAGMLLREELSRLDGFDFNERISHYKIFAIDDDFAVPEKNVNYYEWCGISAGDIEKYILENNI